MATKTSLGTCRARKIWHLEPWPTQKGIKKKELSEMKTPKARNKMTRRGRGRGRGRRRRRRRSQRVKRLRQDKGERSKTEENRRLKKTEDRI